MGGEVGWGRKVREFLPDGLDFLSEKECADTLIFFSLFIFCSEPFESAGAGYRVG